MKTERVITTHDGGVLMSDVTVSPDQASSVEISTNAKGQAQVTVKVYDPDPDAAADKALALYRRLTQQVSGEGGRPC